MFLVIHLTGVRYKPELQTGDTRTWQLMVRVRLAVASELDSKRDGGVPENGCNNRCRQTSVMSQTVKG